MKVEKKMEIIIPDGYEELKNPDISSLRDDDMVTWADMRNWFTVEYCRDSYGNDFHEYFCDNPIYIRKKIVIPTTPGSFFIFKNKLDGYMISWFLDDKGWYAINVLGDVSRDDDAERAISTLTGCWIEDINFTIVLSHDAGTIG